MRVLLAEGSRALAPRLIELIEEVRGARVVAHVTDATAAIKAVAKERPDVAIIEITLQLGTGFDVLRSTRNMTDRPIIIVLTHHVSDVLRAAASGLGADHYFDKTRDLSLLSKTLREIALQMSPRNDQITRLGGQE